MKMNTANKLVLASFFGMYSTIAGAADIYVNPRGNDAQTGSADAPVLTLAKARDLAPLKAGKEAVTVHVADGTYYLPETLVFTVEDSGTAAFPVTYKAENEGGAVLSGGSQLDLKWTPYQNGIFKAATQRPRLVETADLD